MADFDMIRDKTLLFFLDHLMEKGQPRSLHDLSCQFGAKGFTKEMRQIAGGSQSGLKKFLAQFPSLFSIDGDNVIITPLTNDKNGISGRDYARETVEFFSDKLQTYGNAEVPLKSLFGHRSQASSEIRHVSGQNVKEFKEFLHAHQNIFIVRDDYVVLKSVLDNLEKDGQNEVLKRMPEEITFDPYLMQQLVTELEESLFNLTDQYSNKISIDFLFNSVKTKSTISSWNNFIKHPNDLVTFLHMNSRVFLVQANMVSLTAEREQSLRERQSANSNRDVDLLPNKTTTKVMKPQPVKDESLQSSMNEESSQKSPMVANITNINSGSSTIISISPTNSSSNNNSNNNSAAKNKSFNQRIRSQIIKVVTENLQIDSRTSNVHSNNYTNDSNDSFSNQPSSDTFYDSIDLQLIKPKIVVTNKECEDIIADIMKNCTEVTFDLEGINLGTSGEVTLIQIGFIYSKEFALYSRDDTNRLQPKIYLFDVLLNRNLIKAGLARLFESTDIVKVAHDVRNDSVSLYKNFGITLNNVFDTQVAHLVVQQQTTGKPAYKPTKYISMYTLCSLYGGPNLNPKTKDRLHKIYRKDFKYWQRRPLTDEMIQFSMIDVYALLPTVYRTMRDQIRPEYEPLLKQLTHESIFAYIHTDEIKQIKRQRKFELELTDLKLKLFNNDKKKIVLSNREIRLLRYIDLTDEIRNKIEGPQNVAKKLKRFEKKVNGTETFEGGGGNGREMKGEDGKIITQSDDDLDELDYELDDDEMYEEETENESVNSSLKSHEYASEFASNSTDEWNNTLIGKGGVVNVQSSRREHGCCCACHHGGNNDISIRQQQNSSPTIGNGTRSAKQNGDNSSLSPTPNNTDVASNINNKRNNAIYCDSSTQTLSTGDIVITKIFFKDGGQNQPIEA